MSHHTLTLSPGSSLMGTARHPMTGRIVCLMEETAAGLYVAHYVEDRDGENLVEFEANNSVSLFLLLDWPKLFGYAPYVVWCGERSDVACGYDTCSTCYPEVL